MPLRRVALTLVVGASITAGVAWAHGPNGHGKSTVEQCKRILDPDVQAECLRCIERKGHAFFAKAKGEARCTADQGHDHD